MWLSLAPIIPDNILNLRFMVIRISRQRIIKLLAVGIIFGLVSCSSMSDSDSRNPDELIVFAAASLSDSFAELERVFENSHPDVDLILNFASSSQLATQLSEGVTADVFASANENQMQVVMTNGRVDPAGVRSFIANELTILVPAGNPANIQTIDDLGNANVSILMAVEGVPVRDYADQIIHTLPGSDQKAIYENLVSEESNVRQVSTKIALGEADAGIVYTSDITPDITEWVEKIEIPDSLNVIARYPIAAIEDSEAGELAREFIDFVLGETGQEILMDWGFISIQPDVAY